MGRYHVRHIRHDWRGRVRPHAMAIVTSTLTGTPHDPVELSEWSVANGHRCEGNGSYHSLIPAAAEAYGLSWESVPPDDPQAMVDALADGKLVVAIMAKGHFTNPGISLSCAV